MEKKRILNKISTWLCALVIVVGTLGGAVEVRAEGENDNAYYIDKALIDLGYPAGCVRDDYSKWGLPEGAKNYKYHLSLFKTSNKTSAYYEHVRVLCSNSPINFVSEVVEDTTSNSFAMMRVCFIPYSESDICSYTHTVDGAKWSDPCLETNMRQFANFAYYRVSNGQLGLSDTTNCIIGYADYNIYFDDRLVVKGNVSEVYAQDVGYLKNIKKKVLFKYGENYTVDSESAIHRISFDNTSTTGIDITDGNWVVRVFEQMAVYKRSEPTVNCFPNLPKVLIGEFPAENLTFDYNVQDALTLTTEETGEVDGYNAITTVMNGYVRSDNMFYQLYNKLTGKYGGYVLIKGDGTESNISNGTGTTVTPEGDVDDGGYIETPVGGGTGIGSNYDDAEHDANESVSDGTLGDAMNVLEGALNEFTSSVKIVPKVVAECFSFLPDWCLKMFGATIGLACLLIIWKLL